MGGGGWGRVGRKGLKEWHIIQGAAEFLQSYVPGLLGLNLNSVVIPARLKFDWLVRLIYVYSNACIK